LTTSYFKHARKATLTHNTTSGRIGLKKSANKISSSMVDLTHKKVYTPVRIWHAPTAEVSLPPKYPRDLAVLVPQIRVGLVTVAKAA
jgi:hypothetical protein